MTLAVDCEYTSQDYVNSQYLHIRPRRWLYIGVAGFLSLLLMLMVLANLLAPRPAQAPAVGPQMSAPSHTAEVKWNEALKLRSGSGATSTVPLAGCIAFLVFFFFIMIPRRARRLFAQHKDLHVPIRFTFADEGMTMESANGNWRLPWGHILKWRENRQLFLLYPNDALFYMIPKRCLAGDAQVDELRALLTTRAKRMG